MNKKKSILESNVLYTIVAIIAGFLVGAIFLLIAGISPAVAYGKLFDSIFSKPKYLVWTLVYASPLIFTGLSVAFSFRNRQSGSLCTWYCPQASAGPSCTCMPGGGSSSRLYMVSDRRCPQSKTRYSRSIVLYHV